MAQFPINLGGGGGSGSDDCTATTADVRPGVTAIVSGSDDEPVNGTMTEKAAATYYPTGSAQTIAANQYLTGAQTIGAVTTSNVTAANVKYNVNVKVGNANNANAVANVTGTFTSDGTAVAAQIRTGYIAYSKGTKYTGTLSVNSSTSFSVAQTANNKVRVYCQTPTAATGRPWGGLYVRGKSGSYPTSVTDGFEVGRVGGSGYVDYTSSGNMPNGSTIYFRGWDYVYYNENGSTSSYPLTWWGSSHDIGSVYMGNSGYATISSSGTWTLPTGANRVQFFAVGGGGGTGYIGSDAIFGIGGGGGGYTNQSSTLTGTGGTTSYTITIGAGGSAGTSSGKIGGNGGTTSVVSGSTTVATASGGRGTGNDDAGYSKAAAAGGNGGSGGGAAQSIQNSAKSGNGGTNGGNGGSVSMGQIYSVAGGTGQGTSTTFNSVVYSGGGGAGSGAGSAGSGGNWGGGAGGTNTTDPSAGTANSGGGGGGTSSTESNRSGKAGGSGVVIAHYWHA